jgi:hypothetical protein
MHHLPSAAGHCLLVLGLADQPPGIDWEPCAGGHGSQQNCSLGQDKSLHITGLVVQVVGRLQRAPVLLPARSSRVGLVRALA